MRLRPLTAVLTFLLIVGLPVTIQAQSNHVLEWGVDIGDEYTYVLQKAFFANQNYRDVAVAVFPFIAGLELGQKAILSVDALDEIPNPINESSQMPISSCSMTRGNDSVSIETDLRGFVVPIGDWEFLTEMTNITDMSGVTLIDTEEEWGTKGTATFQAGDGSVVTVSIEIRYEKENGTLNYLRERYSTLGTDLIDIIVVNWHPGMPTVLAAGIQLEVILIISIGAVVGLIISSLIYIGRKKKKSIVQQLGE
ncbi:hypothetical protein EU527_04870 [Candidatus Thorarchaeota archaeon]|nr:MAG: hypothetical protein EU527_04870 [Candidatus Thorarchaeota archaeon]